MRTSLIDTVFGVAIFTTRLINGSKLVIFSAFISLVACNTDPSIIISIPSGFDAKVWIDNSTQLEQLVEKEDVADLVGIPVERVRAFYEDFDEDVSSHSLLFSWQNKKSLELDTKNGLQEMPGYSSVGFGRIAQISLADFELKYQPKTSESVKAEILAVTSDTQIDSDIAIWEAKEIARNAKSQTFERLENGGTVAYWEAPLQVLHIWADGVEISVFSNVSQDSDENKKKALEMAELVFQTSTP